MKFFEDMTEEAIAQELSRPLHDVRSAIEKALRKLHRLLSPED
jgi:DNA-directed RNA polymerase specialized sigma24 family protein